MLTVGGYGRRRRTAVAVIMAFVPPSSQSNSPHAHSCPRGVPPTPPARPAVASSPAASGRGRDGASRRRSQPHRRSSGFWAVGTPHAGRQLPDIVQQINQPFPVLPNGLPLIVVQPAGRTHAQPLTLTPDAAPRTLDHSDTRQRSAYTITQT